MYPLRSELSCVADIRLAEGVVVVEDGGEAFLLDTRSRRYFRLNEAGLEVWRALERDAEPTAALAARYPAIDQEVAARDVEQICTRLVEAGLARRATP